MKKMYIKASHSLDDIISFHKSVLGKLILSGGSETAMRLQTDTITYLEELREVGLSKTGN